MFEQFFIDTIMLTLESGMYKRDVVANFCYNIPFITQEALLNVLLDFS